jgi:hypothetical protein
MVRKLSIIVGLGIVLGTGAWALAASKCDSGVAKAAGKLVACECGVYSKNFAKGTGTDTTTCQSKFGSACSKAKGKGDCVVFAAAGSCTAKLNQANSDAASLCNASPSGAFLE